MSAYIVLVEDKYDEANLIMRRFRSLRERIIHAPDIQSAIRKIRELNPILVILDIGLGDEKGGGFQVLNQIQADKRLHHIPILIYSVLGSNPDIVERGLDLDAMWVVDKARGIRELDHYVQRALRMYEEKQKLDPTTVSLYYDSRLPQLWIEGQCRDDPKLSPKLHELLSYLFQWRGHVRTRQDIAEAVWTEEVGNDDPPYDDAINQAVARLRNTLAAYAPDREFIESARGRGYRLRVDPLA